MHAQGVFVTGYEDRLAVYQQGIGLSNLPGSKVLWSHVSKGHPAPRPPKDRRAFLPLALTIHIDKPGNNW